MKRKTLPKLLYADAKGNIFDHPHLCMAGMSGSEAVLPESVELIPLPEGSRLFTIPDTPPVAWDEQQRKFVTVASVREGRRPMPVQAVSAFMAPGYVRLLLPACDYSRKKVHLPLWSYTAVGWDEERDCFVVAASRVDTNQNWNPCNYDDRKLDPLVRQRLAEMPHNRLLEQLARCAVDYHCFAAKNLFFRRWEAPLPTSPACNSRCLGCISLQPSDCCPANHERIGFVPTPEEIVELALPHLLEAPEPIVSYGQGCEGDPIMQADTVAEATRRLKAATSRGTVNFNSNGSFPDRIAMLCDAGMDSMRFSMNSVREEVYDRYYRPVGYRFAEVKESVRLAGERGLFTMINYLVSPGVSDSADEVEALLRFIGETGVKMIQMRNLSIDPDFYNKRMGATGRGIGMYRMLERVKREFPHIQYGYYNRTRENFFPAGYEKGWPIR
ncbi:radical SAM protein [Geobacter sulfurreducens]|jgi:pyruvate-formate lyase-activating enzyme|uniref:Radical SAM domain iron-sulfur cluster-binding oxidoreductase n=1 Tax=Geobacter sulfurreducens (strain ATCC 51573 / DSM 12127 / PCA) TaxID=243231 RepID=Q74ES3_GEOSL|nr:radical SAM protein [Geobacter sulfurreducens]AAR34216.1 radical SAM domain iron-sulfur cluster-binding oxidoreductase [Geobacter sulfurreducens PCA]AJY70625.1 radical SAM protein [Geobacter sulfurreducens]UAC04943.1 radical SAM protein [Geobacter sulfurreducens]HBB70176.1 radical SAM protein [Geobacter sulfurreducens]HCD96775.1 radical SAM protein [Geobacter sulfurreducens]